MSEMDLEEDEGFTDDEEEEDPGTYSGAVDDDGNPHGRGTLVFENGNRFEGKFNHGSKEGKGCFYFSDGSSLQCSFENDEMNGKGVYTYESGAYLVGEYVDGVLCGPAEEYGPDGDLTSRGHYQNNVRCGVAYVYDQFGGCIFGEVDDTGELTGPDITYVYPDEVTGLKGQFKEGKLIKAYEATVVKLENGEFEAKCTSRKGQGFYYDVSTSQCISTSPLLRDPYETKRVYVDKATDPKAGEGLFAKCKADAWKVMSFYNGIRLTHTEVDSRDWSFNNNTISLDEETVIDVPEKFADTSVYCASLGHKANHSFQPNSMYDVFEHPRFGSIKCIRTIKPVVEGEELTVEYGYDHNGLGPNNPEAPQWYKDSLQTFQRKSHVNTEGS